jgi:hypothetical protein
MPRKPRKSKASPVNEFRCAVERTQGQKLCIRIQAHFARNDWVLPVFFLASSFGRAAKNLDQALRFLQQSEEKLWFWGVDRSDDPNLADELLSDFGLRLDRRKDFPRRAAVVTLTPGKFPTAFQLTQLRRELEAMKGTVRLAATGD